MAGHSQFKNIMHRKGAQDAKRAKRFTKLVREIITAARMGKADLDANPRLRTAVNAAKAVNMPKDRIENAIQKGSQPQIGENYEEIRYEGYAPGGIALIVEALTDNRNRTASEVRSTFSKYGGQLGETGSVAFMFEHVGEIIYEAKNISSDAILEVSIESGATDVESTEEYHIIYTTLENFHTVRDALNEKFSEAMQAGIIWKPSTTSQLNGESAEKVSKMVDILEDLDDVQNVYGNYEII
ncbi:YebC/PmpR family DNA-binding transcriptional regulator [Rickettsiales endosymbiont of Stachyamoeba lipophora]|uniref:YebC/PmpR family DNA-binding transcriptional regulator n=1 Tax=Rickettsiales endosymbiont of Stachyamoeba lipophora TaxID=2486578 RepID=UPI000F645D50|nr:YebC/PmpR family DNA-binding transcriptional regulator [Rickettsiales endosymbiont of Stachyamoeba lipophora]AZL15726.1 YebC/PmpR family DNA-binding transcriptional regulator [Rickettsiales endosymbiont of Stachyamoeba lipophora]